MLADKRGAVNQVIAESISGMLPNACYGLDQVAKIPLMNPLQDAPELAAAVDAMIRANAPRPPMHLSSIGKFNIEHVQSVTESLASLAFDNLSFRGQNNSLPILLFKDGTGCMDLRLLVDYDSVEQHRQANPGYWFNWRKQDGTLMRQSSNRWYKIEYPGASGNFLSKSPEYSGQYYIEGLVLRLEYADGSIQHYGIATDDLQDPSVIWLDGLYYVSR